MFNVLFYINSDTVVSQFDRYIENMNNNIITYPSSSEQFLNLSNFSHTPLFIVTNHSVQQHIASLVHPHFSSGDETNLYKTYCFEWEFIGSDEPSKVAPSLKKLPFEPSHYDLSLANHPSGSLQQTISPHATLWKHHNRSIASMLHPHTTEAIIIKQQHRIRRSTPRVHFTKPRLKSWK